MVCKERWVWRVALVLFFFASLILSVGVPDMYNSPDERAFATVIERFRDEGVFWEREFLNPSVGGVLGPRSMRSLGDRLLPVGFMGLPVWYGILGALLPFAMVGWITPALAVLALCAWRRIVARVFVSERVGTLAGWIALLLPGFLFYSARLFMPSVPFVSLLIIGLYFLLERPLTRRSVRVVSSWPSPCWRDLFFAGAALGTALFFRTSEGIWIAGVGAVLLFFFPRALSWKQISLLFVSVLLFAAPFFLWNTIAFGSPLRTGYATNVASSSLSVSRSLLSVQSEDTRVLFPFGIAPKAALGKVATYQFERMWWIALLALLGLPALFATRSGRAIGLASLLAGTYLVLFYGSWNISDTPDPTAETLANSYVRYWLPLSFAMTIPAALALDSFLARVRHATGRGMLASALILLVVFFSIRIVYFHPDDGLLATRRILLENVEVRAEIISRTEADSVIVVDRADKVLFPRRRVVTPLRREATLDVLPLLVTRDVPLYYFGLTLPVDDLLYLNGTLLSPRGLRAEERWTMGDQTLYQFASL